MLDRELLGLGEHAEGEGEFGRVEAHARIIPRPAVRRLAGGGSGAGAPGRGVPWGSAGPAVGRGRGRRVDYNRRASACRAGRASRMSAPPASQKKIRVVVAKPGLDGHDRGAKIIARALRDAGMEVIYTGLHQTPDQIVETVIQEDADAVGLSILSGAHMTLVPRIVELLKAQGIDDVVITVGGTIPADDIPELKRLGVAEVFTPGASTQSIIDFIRTAVAAAA